MEMGKVAGEVVEEERSLLELVRPLVPGLLEVEQDGLGGLGDTQVVRLESHSRIRTSLLMILMSRKVTAMVYDPLLVLLADVQVVIVAGNSGIVV